MTPKRFPIGFKSNEAAQPGAALHCTVHTGQLHHRAVQLLIPDEFCLLDLKCDGDSQFYAPGPMLASTLRNATIDVNLPPDTVVEVTVQNIGQDGVARYCYGALLCEHVAPIVEEVRPLRRVPTRRTVVEGPPDGSKQP